MVWIESNNIWVEVWTIKVFNYPRIWFWFAEPFSLFILFYFIWRNWIVSGVINYQSYSCRQNLSQVIAYLSNKAQVNACFVYWRNSNTNSCKANVGWLSSNFIHTTPTQCVCSIKISIDFYEYINFIFMKLNFIWILHEKHYNLLVLT